MPTMPDTRALKVWRGEYDFAIDGGAQSTIVLRTTDGPLPLGAIILGGILDILTACLSATGTMQLNSEAAADLLAATAQAGLTLGRKAIIPVFTAPSSVKTTAERNPALVIATAAFTAGKFRLTLTYL
jgi:hypothetical protein